MSNQPGNAISSAGAAAVLLPGRYPATTFALELHDVPIIVRDWEPGLRLLVANLVTSAAHTAAPAGTYGSRWSAGRDPC